MPEVLEIEQVEVEKKSREDSKIASWLVEIPLNIINELGLAQGSKVALTINNGEVSGDLLLPMSHRIKEISRRIFEENREVYEELKRLGD